MTTPLLEGRGLSIRYGGVIAIDGVDVAVNSGELVGLIGPNGAGKTSLLNGLSGFAAMSGHVLLDGRGVEGLSPHRRSRCGMTRTWQSHQLFDDLTVRENVAVAADSARWWSPLRDLVRGSSAPTTDAEDALVRVGMEHLGSRLPGELSHGQRSMVGIARALASRPHVLLMDEPAAGLDSAESIRLGATLRQIVDSGVSILLIEHDMSLVRQICDRVYVLDFGRRIAAGSPAEVYDDPAVIAAYLGEEVDEFSPGTSEDPVDGQETR